MVFKFLNDSFETTNSM